MDDTGNEKAMGQYVKLKDENKRYRVIHRFYNDILIKELKNMIRRFRGLDIQPSGILDNREMVEVRHRLNVRRQKLRERIDTSQKQKEAGSYYSLVKAYPDIEKRL